MRAVLRFMPGECRLSRECGLCFGSCLENAGCTLVNAWRVLTLLWFMPGECGLYFGSCLENAGYPENADCALVHAWRMLTVLWFMPENAGCAFIPVWRMRAVT